jgi:hypothetical protein
LNVVQDLLKSHIKPLHCRPLIQCIKGNSIFFFHTFSFLKISLCYWFAPLVLPLKLNLLLVQKLPVIRFDLLSMAALVALKGFDDEH